MKPAKRTKLQSLGYRVTDTQIFLGLTDEESALIELKILLIQKLKRLRTQKGLTQAQLARLIHSSQPRIAMLERGRPNISLDLICKALFALGLTRPQLAKTLTARPAA